MNNTNVWMPVRMVLEAIEGKRVLINGLYEHRKDGTNVIARSLCAGSRNTLYVDFEETYANAPRESMTMKRFVKTYALVGVQ